MTETTKLSASTNSLGRFDATSVAEETAKWEIDPNEIEIGEMIGTGSFGSVYKGRLRGKLVAVKKINPQDNAAAFDPRTLAEFRMEVAVMSKLRHPNVLLFMGASIQPDCLMIVTELMALGSVADLLKNPETAKALTFSQRMKMAKDAALGMNWLHLSTPVFIHRDLKTANLLVDANRFVKVADFGLTVVKVDEAESAGMQGSPVYMAPEVLAHQPFDESCDVYSFGLILWELLTGEVPFKDITSLTDLQKRVVKLNERPTIPDDCPKNLREVMEKCWHADPKQRPKFQQLVDEIDYIIVEGTIKDPLGCKFWFQHIKSQDRLPFPDWLAKFCIFLNIKPAVRGQPALASSSTEYQFLKVLISQNEQVTMEQFDDFVQWYGPLMPNKVFLDKVAALLQSDWFHGDLSGKDAERLLTSTNQPGTFLVRYSSQPGSFTVSSLSRTGAIKLFRVHRQGDKYVLGDEQFATLAELLQKNREKLTTYYPCKSNKYSWIFSPEQASKAQYLVD